MEDRGEFETMYNVRRFRIITTNPLYNEYMLIKMKKESIATSLPIPKSQKNLVGVVLSQVSNPT
jgi:hypothetical protein